MVAVDRARDRHWATMVALAGLVYVAVSMVSASCSYCMLLDPLRYRNRRNRPTSLDGVNVLARDVEAPSELLGRLPVGESRASNLGGTGPAGGSRSAWPTSSFSFGCHD